MQDRLAHGLLVLFYTAALLMAAVALFAVGSRLVWGRWPALV
jgi:hypothetical protein